MLVLTETFTFDSGSTCKLQSSGYGDNTFTVNHKG